VVVQIEKRGQDKDAVSKIEILAEQKGDWLQVEARHTAKTGFVFGVFHSPSARLIANVPRQTNLVVRTGDGNVVVERVTGKAEIRTSDGSIRMTETGGNVTVETGDGSVTLEDVSGRWKRGRATERSGSRARPKLCGRGRGTAQSFCGSATAP
jgi:hypothetical protein